MRLPRRQHGMGWFGMLIVLGLIAFFATVAIKTVPIYLNQGKVKSAVAAVAANSGGANATADEIRLALQRRWDIEDIDFIDAKGVKLQRKERSASLAYAYEARTHLFYNVDVVFAFEDDVPLGGQ